MDYTDLNREWSNYTLSFISLYFTFFGILWLLGIDGFIWGVLPLLFFKAYRFDEGKFILNKTFFLGISIYLVSVFVSLIFIDSTFRILNWFRDTATILTFFFLLVFISSLSANDLKRKVIKPIKIFFSIAIVFGLSALLFDLNFDIKTPMAYILPSAITSTDYGGRLVIKNLITESYFLNFSYLRLSSIFTYATSFSYALAVFLVAYITNPALSRSDDKKKRYFFILGGIICLLFTTARTGIIGLITGLCLYYFLKSNSLKKVLISIAFLCLIGLVLYFDLINVVIEARGGGSAYGRSTVYLHSIAKVLSNPLGYGSYMDFKYLSIPYPLGSHSTWIGVLFKSGVFGFIGFALCFLGILKNKFLSLSLGKDLYKILPAFITFFAISLLEEFYLDILTALSIAILLGLILNNNNSGMKFSDYKVRLARKS